MSERVIFNVTEVNKDTDTMHIAECVSSIVNELITKEFERKVE